MIETQPQDYPIAEIRQEPKLDNVEATLDNVEATLLGPMALGVTLAETPVRTERFLTESLCIEREVSVDGFVRPVFRIAGRRVAFRNRQELVDYPGETVTILGNETEPPLDMNNLLTEATEIEKSERRAKCESIINFNTEHNIKIDSPEKILIVPNTVLGLLEASVVLGRADLKALHDEVAAGNYGNPALAEITDGIIGVIALDDEGKPVPEYDTSNYAIVLAALVGEEEAQRIVNFKKLAVREIEERRVYKIAERKQSQQLDSEPLPLNHTALVHVTSHGVHVNGDGEVEIFPTGQFDELVGRSTVHYTINSVVCPRSGIMDETTAWAADNSVIIGLLSDVMAATGRKPDTLKGVDTWYSLNPGESVRIPRATIIEPTKEGEDVISVSGSRIKILIKDSYSEKETDLIGKLAREYKGFSPIEDTKMVLQATAVQIALSRLGIAPDERCAPSADGYGMADLALENRILATAIELGAQNAGHFSGPEFNVETNGWRAFDSAFRGDMLAPSDHISNYVGLAPLAALRWMVLRGALPAIPQKFQEEEIEDYR